MKIQILHIKMKCTGFLTLLARIPKYNSFAKGPLIFGDKWLENLGKQPKQGNLLFCKLGSGEIYQGILALYSFVSKSLLGFPTCQIKLFAKNLRRQFSGKICPAFQPSPL